MNNFDKNIIFIAVTFTKTFYKHANDIHFMT